MDGDFIAFQGERERYS